MTAHVDPTKHDTAKSVDFGAPFDSANADVIIRSSDLVDFRVFKTTLAQASPVFEDIFHHIPSALVGNVIKLDRTKDGLPVICLPEGRAVVHSLLTSIFPVPVYVPTSFRALAPVLAAAQRYQMINGLSLLRICASASDTNLITQDNALEAYCVACYHGLAEEASTAAALTVNQSLALALEDFGEDIQLLSGPSIFALWNYHERILKAAREGLLNLKATTSTSQLWQTTMAGSRHKCVAPGEDGTTPAWLIQCARAIAAGTHKISDFRLVHIKHALKSHCPFCIGISEETLAVVYNDLKEHISACMPSSCISFIDSPDSVPLRLSKVSDFGPPWNQAHADIIVRSSDLVDFRFYKSILAMASTVFDDMLTFPQPPRMEGLQSDDYKDGLPVVVLPEDANTLCQLLGLVYRVQGLVLPVSFDEAAPLLAVCQKYDMVGTSSLLRSMIGSGHPNLVTDDNPFHAYALASRYHLTPETRATARLTLSKPMTLDEYRDDLRLATGPALLHLAQYRTECCNAVAECIIDALQDTSPTLSRIPTDPGERMCIEPEVYSWFSQKMGVVVVPAWWNRHFRTLAEDVRSGRACPIAMPGALRTGLQAAIDAHVHQPYSPMSRCAFCHSGQTALSGGLFLIMLERDIKLAVEKVEISTEWCS